MADVLELETKTFSDSSAGGEIEQRELRFTNGLEIEERADGEGLPMIRGYAVVYGKKSVDMGFFETVQKGAFTESLTRGDEVMAKLEHQNGTNLLGSTTTGTLRTLEKTKGLYIEIDPPDTTVARDTVELIRAGLLKKMSFAFRTVEDKWSTIGGREHRLLIKADLLDVSVVTNPAYQQTSVGVRSLEEIAEEGRLILHPGTPKRDAAERELAHDRMQQDLINEK